MNASDGRGSYGPGAAAVPWVVAVVVATWLLVALLQLLAKPVAALIQAQCVLDPASFFGQGHVWQPLTAILVHAGLGQAVMNGLVLWVFGADLEREWRRGEMLALVLVCGLCSGVCFLGLARAVTAGAGPGYPSPTGVVLGVMAAYGVVFAHRSLSVFGLVSLRARTLVMVVLAVQVLLFVVSGAWWVEAAAVLAGAVAGYLVVKLVWWYQNRRAGQAVGRGKPRGRFGGLEGMPDEPGRE